MRFHHGAGIVAFMICCAEFPGAATVGDTAVAPTAREGGGRWIEQVKVTGSSDDGNGHTVKAAGTVLVYLPKDFNEGTSAALVIALHGWNQQASDWRANTAIADFADKRHAVVAFPDMGKTVYESRFYPKTALRWNAVPGARWIGEVVLPYMRAHYGAGKERGHTAIIGVSTGGRGAVVVAERYPEFSFCAGLSGTYDLNLPKPSEGEYRIHALVFGSRDSFPDRWKTEDCINPAYAAALKPVSVYLAHGLDDQVVSEDQLESMRRFLAGFHTNNRVVAVYKEEHGWPFWDSQLGAVFEAMAVAFGEHRPVRP